MKTMYIECNMGAAGDMLMAALLEYLPESDGFIKRMNSAEDSRCLQFQGKHLNRITVLT